MIVKQALIFYIIKYLILVSILQFCLAQTASASQSSFIEAQLKRVGWGQYMAQNCSNKPYPGWRAFGTVECLYNAGQKFGLVKVVMLNPKPNRLAKWIVTACSDINAKYPIHCAEQLALRIKCQSGNQFVVAGFVKENGQLYVFRDGVTVELTEFAKLKRRPTSREQQYALVTGNVKKVKKFARILGTSRGEYAKFKKVPARKFDGIVWKRTIRKAYQKAWVLKRNDLISAWAEAHKDEIDHKGIPGSRFGTYCKSIGKNTKNWRKWPIYYEQ